MNLADLQKIDLKDFSLDKFIRGLFERLETASITIVILILFGTLIFIFQQYRSQEEDLQKQIKLMQEKIKTIQDYEESLKTLETYMASLPQNLEEGKVVKQLAVYATQNHVIILSFIPLGMESGAFDSITKIRLTVWVKTYKDMVRFIRTIETSPFGLRIDSWSGGLQNHKFGLNGVGATIEISSIKIKK